MKTVGIICEYNPFHKGHLYQINKAKEITGADFVVAIMSGNFVQRGAPAIIDKHLRTKICLENNIDLVIELPVQWSTASAEYFAFAAVTILEKMNVIDYISFGCEYDNLEVLNDIAEFLVNEPVNYTEILKTYMSAGLSFPKSREAAIKKSLKYKFDISEIISSPNNILAIEYLKALKKINSSIKPVGIKRIGSGYNENVLSGDFSSATAIRHSIKNYPENLNYIQNTVPYDINKIIKNPIFEDDFSILLGEKLLSSDTFDFIFDVNESLGKRIDNLKNNFISFSSFANELKTKNTTLTSVNRALMHILLGIKKTDIQEFAIDEYIYYLRILGLKKASSKLLTELKARTKLPIISKIADYDTILEGNGKKMLESNIKSDKLYRLILMNKFQNVIPNEYKKGIIINS